MYCAIGPKSIIQTMGEELETALRSIALVETQKAKLTLRRSSLINTLPPEVRQLKIISTPREQDELVKWILKLR